jgi:hypothetical protein
VPQNRQGLWQIGFSPAELCAPESAPTHQVKQPADSWGPPAAEDDLLVREMGGLRWYRCLRRHSWLPEQVPAAPGRAHPPDRANISLPLRGRPLRERYVVRLIALERSVHVLVLVVLSVAVFAFAVNKSWLHQDFVRIVDDLQGGAGGPVGATSGGIEHELARLFAISTRNLHITALAAAAYGLLEVVEVVGLWRGLRWAA